MGVGWTSKLILAFVTLLIGVVLIGQVASQGNERTNKAGYEDNGILVNAANNGTGINASYVLSLTEIGDTNVDCPITEFVLTNSTGHTLTLTTHYVPDLDAGTFTLTNASFNFVTANNVTNATYTYCPTGYMTQAWGRTAVDLAPGFFAIALLLTSISLFYSVYQDFKGM